MNKLIDMIVLNALAAFGAQVYNDATTIDELQDQLLDLNEKAESIQAAADAEQRDLTQDEQEEIDGIFREFKNIENSIERRERINAQGVKLAARVGRQTDPVVTDDDNDAPQASAAAPGKRGGSFAVMPVAQKGKWGFKSFGDFAMSVRSAAMPNNGGRIDPRLMQNAPTTYSSEGVGADGGFLVPPDFRTTIMEAVMAETSLLGRTDGMTSNANSLVLPKDTSSNWQTSGGIQAYWEGEADQMTQSKLNLSSDQVRLNKLTALVPVTEELLDDASAVDSYLRKKVPEKFDFKINNAIVNGTGAGMPLGFMNSGALITVAKESGQSAATLVFENIVNMYSRMQATSRSNAIWLVNQDIEPQLLSMGFPTSGTAVPVYLPPGGLSASPYGSLMGRPVIPTEAAQTLGTTGDISFVDLTQYLTAVKTQGIRTDVSIHLWFDYDVMAYRFIFRVAGQPWLDAAIDPLNGSVTHSPFVTLATRS